MQKFSCVSRLDGVMTKTMTLTDLQQGSDAFDGTGGVSAGNRSLGYLPAFIDHETGRVYLSLDKTGAPSMIHQFGGLPADVVTQRDQSGQVLAVKGSLEAGFVFDSEFYTREQCAQRLQNASYC